MTEKNDFSQGNIQMIAELGKGSFGQVYSGKLKSNGLKIAIKRINKHTISKYGDYLIDAFYKELECMKKCDCENSVRFYTNFETSNNYNIIMELCDNDLSNELKKRPNGFNVEEVRYIMSQLNNAFKKMVQYKIIHRDLKLGNILITYTDETKTKFIPKLCDYGFSKELKDKDPVTTTHLGTPATMAPEIMRNEAYNEEADLWSVGVLIYQLHFNDLPFKGKNEKEIYEKIRKKTPYTQPENLEMRDLINKLLVEDPKKRLTWSEYFSHPFFPKEKDEEKEKVKDLEIKENNMEQKGNKSDNGKDIIYIGNGDRYIYEQDFDVGFKSDMFKCCIAKDTRKNKKVFIKSYKREFISSHELIFKMEYNLIRTFQKNNNFLQIINIDIEKYHHLIFDYVDCEILPSYLAHNEFDEEKLKKLNKELLDKIFIFSEINFKPFIFISLYSFAITKEGKPLIFDFGLNKFFLSNEEVMQYYMPNMSEIAESLSPIKTNVMNYGITLLKCLYGKNFQIKITNDEIILPDNKNLSDDFKKFLSKCLKKNIENRDSWLRLKKEEFVQDLNINIEENKKEDITIISDKKLKGIFKSLDNKYDLINKYYDLLDINEKKSNINEIEYFLILTLFEQLIILKILKNEENNYPENLKEISFISIFKDQVEEFKINFGNPILQNMKIFNNNEIIQNFVSKLQKHISKLKEITLKIHKITKSTFFKGNYQNFLKEFNKIMTNENYKDYFLSLTVEANNDWLNKKYDKIKLKAPIAEYISETVFFIIMSIINIEKEKIYFKSEELLKKFNAIFEKEDENDIQVSCVKLTQEKEKYILVSFLGIFFKYLINSMNLNRIDMKKNKSSLGNLLSIYHRLMETLVNIK